MINKALKLVFGLSHLYTHKICIPSQYLHTKCSTIQIFCEKHLKKIATLCPYSYGYLVKRETKVYPRNIFVLRKYNKLKMPTYTFYKHLYAKLL